VELVRIRLWGYKRFSQETVLNADGKVVALIGPNEAGKTTLLQALTRLNDDDDFAPTERTRGPQASRETGIQAIYALGDADRDLLRKLPGGKDGRRLVVTKRGGGGREWRVEPELHRDLRRRELSIVPLTRLVKSKLFRENADPETQELVTVLLADLDSEEETLSAEVVERLRLVTQRLIEDENYTLGTGLRMRLEQLHAAEHEDPPAELAAETLEQHRPDFLFFSDDERRLDPSYSLDGSANAALTNLLRLADLGWEALQSAYHAQDVGHLEALLEHGNARLKEEYGRSWSQKHTPLTVRLRIDNGLLHILIPRGATDYISITERSEGLRQFIALRAFVAAKDALEPVLLIDEAERHLHYDAQADLVEVLTEQTDAPKVIYSTHSAGCLPKDLGTGVRAVAPIEGTDYSHVENWFWTRGLGFTPLLIGMGASALAFASARKAVIAEGITEALLLPTLVREVVGERTLDYQVAPGLSNASRAAIDDLDLIAARVVYLVDGDEGGQKLKRELLDRDVPEDLVFVLGEGTTPGLTLEDLISEGPFLAAVNAELKRQGEAQVAPGELVSPVRWRSLRAWCQAQSPPVEVPSKRAVAQRLLEARHDDKLVAKEHRATLRNLHRALLKALKQPTHARRR
jgi:energy-coupling factor transporter ATP-binding protein EcfA2